MKKIFSIILFITLSLSLAKAGIIVSMNTIILSDKKYEIHDGIKSTNEYICIGKNLKIPIDYFMSLDENDIFVLDDSILCIGKYKYRLSKQDIISQYDYEEKNEEVRIVGQPENTDDIVEVNSRVLINRTKCILIKDGKEIPLHGRVKIVDSSEDIKVKVVDDKEDLDVCLDDRGSSCCHFEIRDDFYYDIEVKIVSSSEDIKVKIVDGAFHSVSIP